MFSILSDFLLFHKVFSMQGHEKKNTKSYAEHMTKFCVTMLITEKLTQ